MSEKDSSEPHPDVIKQFDSFLHWEVKQLYYKIPHNVLDREDLFQTGAEALLIARQQWKPAKGPWESYAMTKARFAMIDMLRKVHGRKGGKKIAAKHVEFNTEIHAPSFEDDVTDPLLPKQIEDLLSTLPLMEQAVIDLYCRHNISVDDIAATYGVSPSRISQLFHAGINRLGADIRALGIAPPTWSETRRKQFSALHNREFLLTCVEQGMTIRQICAQLDMSRKTVREKMRHYHIRPVGQDPDHDA